MEAEGSRMGHMVEHSFAVFGALLGMALGALAFGALAVLTVATGGIAGALLIGAAAAGGASLGGVIGKRYGQRAKSPTGPIIVPCSLDVLYEGIPAAHTTSGVMCSGMPGTPVPHPAMLVAEGSTTVLINGMMAARKGSKTTCGASVGEGCASIIIGGDTAVHPGLTVKSEFPKWLDTTINVLGLVGIVGIFTIGVVPGLIALAGGIAGATIFSWIGGMIFGEGSDGQFWMGLAGGFIGGLAAARAALGWRAGANVADEAANIADDAANIADDAANVADEAANTADDAANIADDAANVADEAANTADDAANIADDAANVADDAANVTKARKANSTEETKIDSIRNEHQIGKKKNVAYAEGVVDGESVYIKSHSGQNSKPGTVKSKPFEDQILETSPTRGDVNKGQTTPDRRAYDSEVKAMEEILNTTTPESTGKIKIVTERDLCGSCSKAVGEFKKLRPNIEVETVYSKPYNN